MNILVIPEDFRKDQYILKPIFEAMLAAHGKPHAKIRICNPPLLQGVTEALKDDRLEEIISRYSFVDIFVLCVDRDGQLGRKDRLEQIEGKFSSNKIFIAEHAWEELEVWVLAGLQLPKGWVWKEVRSEVSVKEKYFDAIAKQFGVADGPGGGRKYLGELAKKKFPAMLAKCPEDLGRLSTRILAAINTP